MNLNRMSSGANEENLMMMTKDDLQRWIQTEVNKNPQLVQRHEQLAQVEEWVKQKESDATHTRILYSSACETQEIICACYGKMQVHTRSVASMALQSVLECESVMKGLYGMLGLDYRDVDSEEEEGGGVKEPQDVIQIIDDEVGEEKSWRDDDDIVFVDMGATKETLEPMLEKVTVAIEKSSRLVQDLVQMVTKTSSIRADSSSDIYTRPSSISTSEMRSACESLEPTDSSIAIVKTESLSMATTAKMFSPEHPVSTHNSDFTAKIKTEPQSAPLMPEISSLHNCKDQKALFSHGGSSLASVKRESEMMSVTPPITIAGYNSDAGATVKTEPQLTPVISNISSLSSNSHPFSVKTEPQSKPLFFEIPPVPSKLEKLETTMDHKSDSMVTLKSELLLTTLKTEQPKTIPDPSLDLHAIKTEPQLAAVTPEPSSSPIVLEKPQSTPSCNSPSKTTEMSSELPPEPPKNSEQDNTISSNKSPPTNKKAAKRKKSKSPEPSPSTKAKLKTSETASSVSHTSDSQKETARSASHAESSDDTEIYDTEELDSHTQSDETPNPPPESSSNTAAKNTTSNQVTTPPPTTPPPVIKKPAASAKPSDSKRASSAPSSKSSEPTKTHAEIKLKVDMVALGKGKKNAWYRGTVVETQTPENDNKYKLEFKKGKIYKIPPHHLACMNPPLLKDLFIGCRVVVSYKDAEDKTCFGAAVLAELPDRKNRMRFLVFYDDGRVAYVALPDLHLVCKQLKKVWRDIDDETCSSQVKEYLRVYPNPIAVVLRVGQDTKAERDGKFQACTVDQLDGSLIQICFKGDKQKEWVYKGSDKLEHIVTIKKRLAQQKTQPANKTGNNTASSHVTRQTSVPNKTPSQSPQNATTAASATQKTQNTDATVTKTPSQSSPNDTPAVSATPQTNTTVTKPPTVSPKNVTPAVSSTHVKPQTVNKMTDAPSISPQNAKSAAFQPKVVLQKLAIPPAVSASKAAIQTIKSGTAVDDPNLRSAKRPSPDEDEDHVFEKDQPKFTNLYHRCCPACLDGVRPKNVDMHHGQNPLQIPLLFKFRRMTARRRLDGKVFFHIFYRSPCGRSLCDMQEVQVYLFETQCDFLFLDMFCMDPFVLVNRARPPSTSTNQPNLYLPDISEGKEVLPLPCVNEVDHTPAPSIRYTKDRSPAPGVSINTSLDFLTGCDCTDGCRDRTKCSCHQMTIEATSLCSGGPVDVTAGYTYKRLQTTLPTGVYECNPLCRCNHRICSNRLVQHGLQLRLELFMTQHKGWGIRCKDDVAKGTFVCVFTGKVMTEDKVNEDDMVSGNEYLANLDFIEGVEKLKEGYESEAYCSDTENESNKKTITMKTGPLWKNTIFHEDSSSGEEKDEAMQLDTDKVKTDGQEASGPKRCFAIKSFERRVKLLETSDARKEKTWKAQLANNTRRLFDGEETCYIIDARQEGNLGRFINHSCSPNLFVQNVFVDTHDLRFPWVAFFASKRIKAGTELTWDYNYEVGSVEGKVLLCCCGSSRCTGRLL
ncbi:histone-lysine N-methyltransferase SETDB1-A isoform X2 [Paramisgurnus dabryanus]|uniref:histone-lysine N-methyltransferase SETDB1-A isoform X2 n=1 Tax=Paramisgurnus dabryanus TaxID=90735 RepID=UPI0031F40C0B